MLMLSMREEHVIEKNEGDYSNPVCILATARIIDGC